MRDYKNVKVPRAYRTTAKRTTVKRVNRISTGPEKSTGLKGIFPQVLVFFVIAGGIWLGWQAYMLLTNAEMFQISGVDVKGVQQLGEADLKKIAGVFTGQNIFQADIDAAARRAQASPWVKEVRIHRSLPNRITMTFLERVPHAVLDTGTGRYLMDREGVVIVGLKEAGRAWELPVIAIKDYSATPGQPVSHESLVEAFTLLDEIAARGGWNAAGLTVKANSLETLALVYADHEFRIGSGNYSEKLRRLAEVMADAKERGLQVASVDVRAERQAAVMVRK